MAEKLDARADELIDAAVQQGVEGDWRATQMLLEQTFGRPPVELTGADGGPIEFEVSASRTRLAEKLSQLRERAELGDAGPSGVVARPALRRGDGAVFDGRGSNGGSDD